MSAPPSNLHQTLAHHDAAIGALTTRVGHVEQKLDGHDRKLDQIIHAVTKADATPKFNFHQTVSTIVALAILFSMVCGGIIYIVRAQSEAVLAEQKAINSEQKAFNGTVGKILDRHDDNLTRLNTWAAGTITQKATR